jgi:carbamate kinase
MGYMIEQSLQNKLHRLGIKRDVVTIVTQVIVDPDDPSIINPTKYVGPFYTEKQARALSAQFGWVIREDSGRGFRRLVPSPIPVKIINRHIIRQLVDQGAIVIAAGGGAIPVYIEQDGTYEGVDAVIDKDRATAVLARDIGARTLMILTGVDNVCLNFRKPDQVKIEKITAREARDLLAQGQFPAGSMGPKIEAAVGFLESGGEEVIITSLEKAKPALLGSAGTHIVK